MATHDYVIDNQTAPNFRADLNNALSAIVSQNSSATAPSTTYANMIWYDTANNQLKKRDEANSAWITLGTIDEALGTFLPNALASQAEAEAGTATDKLMTSQRTKQAIDVQVPAVLNATGSAPIYACRAWVNFNGTGTVSIRGSGNVSSITDNGTGDYTVNFTTAMPDANYAVSGLVDNVNTFSTPNVLQIITLAAGSVRVRNVAAGSKTTQGDVAFVTLSIFR